MQKCEYENSDEMQINTEFGEKNILTKHQTRNKKKETKKGEKIIQFMPGFVIEDC